MYKGVFYLFIYQNFSVKGLDLFVDFLFFEILELYDFELVGNVGGCRLFHFMPRFARHLPSNGKEILSMHHVVQNLLKMSRPIIEEKDLKKWLECDQITWERYAEEHKGMIVTCPGKVGIVSTLLLFLKLFFKDCFA